MLRLKAQGAVDPRSAHKAVIMIFLSGGPSHIDTYDMKPDAPEEYRGEFRPIQTRVTGMQFCELMPQQARIADKLAVLRGVQTVGNHTGNEFFSAYAWEQGKPDGVTNQQRPAFGSVVSRLRTGSHVIPAYVSLHDNPTWERPYYLGAVRRLPDRPGCSVGSVAAGRAPAHRRIRANGGVASYAGGEDRHGQPGTEVGGRSPSGRVRACRSREGAGSSEPAGDDRVETKGRRGAGAA
jgi:Protein of unknown function (DUF1501)